jgi:L-2-hydroxyglutarate oxidase LhgO
VLEAVGRALGSLARFSGARALDLAAVTAGWRRPLLKAAGASAKGVLV